jgi:hypothetical protein
MEQYIQVSASTQKIGSKKISKYLRLAYWRGRENTLS